MQSAPLGESLFMALLFSMIRIPDPIRDNHQQDRRLRLAIARLVLRFREYGNVRFSDEQGLNDQLYIHRQALNRSVFAIGIDNTLPEEFSRLYPRLVELPARRFTASKRNTMSSFQKKRSALVAVIFGARLMQEKDLHEKQIILLTGSNEQLEAHIEQQLRELTLLPLNVKHMPMQDFQRGSAAA